MARRRLGTFRRGSGKETEPATTQGEQRLTPERAAREPGRVGRFMAWLGFGPEGEEGAAPERGTAEPEEAERPAENAERTARGREEGLERERERHSPASEARPAAAEAEGIAPAEDQGAAEDQPAADTGVVSLSTASLDELLGLGMSATQARRVLDYRERMDGFDSLDDLDHLPGFPRALLSQVKERLTL